VASLVDRFVENRRRRQDTMDAHLDEIDEALAEGDPLKFAFWVLDQDPAFFASDSPAPRMLEMLGRDLELTSTQLQGLTRQRGAIRTNRDTLARCSDLLAEARDLIHAHIDSSAMVMETIRQVLSPVQVR
jgi:hypothetical protein